MRVTILLVGLFFINACGTLNPQQAKTKPVSHQLFDELLKRYVTDEGLVDYRGFMTDSAQLTEYIDLLSNNAPNDSNWSEDDQIAYWINLYNAATIDLVLQYYPVASIKDIGSSIQVPFVNTPWDIQFMEIASERYDLNNIEHNILRKKWAEPRIHFAINCASLSCPKLRREAYEGDLLQRQLDEQAREFVNDHFRNDITTTGASLSKLFDWFGGDFKKKMPLRAFINQYSDVKISEEVEISYKEYDWRLNDVN